MLEIKRHFTVKDGSPYASVAWKTVRVPLCEYPVEAPAFWSDTAIEIAVAKYFRKPEGESSVRQLFTRVVNAIRDSGEAQGYFQSNQAQIFADELQHILIHQIGSFNSPVYFNVGIFPSYG